jgi:hypothetical protein
MAFGYGRWLPLRGSWTGVRGQFTHPSPHAAIARALPVGSSAVLALAKACQHSPRNGGAHLSMYSGRNSFYRAGHRQFGTAALSALRHRTARPRRSKGTPRAPFGRITMRPLMDPLAHYKPGSSIHEGAVRARVVHYRVSERSLSVRVTVPNPRPSRVAIWRSE